MRKTLIAMTLFGISNVASADFLGLYVGGGSWSHDPSGSFGSTQAGSDTIDMKSDVGLDKESETYLWLALDHPVPVLPNIRLESTGLRHAGTASGSLSFLGNNSATGATVVDLTSTDIIPYYRLLDNWVNLDLGLVARKLDGEVTIGADSQELSVTVPMLYLAAQFDLPLTGLSIGGDIKTLSVGDNSLSDVRLRALYEMGVVGFELGTRTTNITLKDESNINADIDFKGVMFGMYLHF